MREEKIQNPFEIKRLTTTTLFLLPVMGFEDKVLANNGFLNSYIGDVDMPPEDCALFCLFQPIDTSAFNMWMDTFEDVILYDYDYDDGYVVVVLKFPEAYKTDFKLVTEGKYSKTSREFQLKFPDKIVFEVEGKSFATEHPTYRVFNKNVELKNEIEEYYGVQLDKDTEFFPAFDNSKEILSILDIMENNENNNL